MAKVTSRLKSGPPRHYIREWRKHRGMTLEELAAATGVSDGGLSLLERGKFSYTQPMLEVLAEALSCEPRDLIGRPPNVEWGIADATDRGMAETWKRATSDERALIWQVAQKLVVRTGSDG